MSEQKIMASDDDYKELQEYLKEESIQRILLVCGASINSLRISTFFNSLEQRTGIEVIRFSDFQPNPRYDSVEAGVRLFQQRKCDMIIAVGGGSAMDVAKCIKLYCNMDSDINYLRQTIIPNDVKLMVVPTTAGTGSEATKFAVIYYEGEKQSVTHESIIPSAVLMDASVLKTLPDYQKKTTMLDALCHAIESFWSVNSTEESREYSKKAIQLILANADAYLMNADLGNAKMLEAANIAGKAINITQTTAGHAMCYKLTGLYGISHGHAAALCVDQLWEYMITHLERCIDPRGKEYLEKIFSEIASAFGCNSMWEAVRNYHGLIERLDLEIPVSREEDFEMLKTSVNPVRLKNNPIELDMNTIEVMYRRILKGRGDKYEG